MFGRSPVAGSSQIRHAVYTPEGVLVYRHAGFTQPLLIPQAYAAKVVGTIDSSANGTLSGVMWEGANVLLPRLSRHWKADKKEAANAATTLPEYLPFVVIKPEALDVEFLRCTCCDRLFVSVHDYAAHNCPSPRCPRSVLPSARALAFAASPHQSSAAPRALLAPAAGVLPLPAGWARHPPRDTEKLDETSLFHLTQWFEEGQASGKTKCSAARAVGRLLALRGVDGAELYDEESVPSEERIKRFFGSLSQQQKANQRVDL